MNKFEQHAREKKVTALVAEVIDLGNGNYTDDQLADWAEQAPDAEWIYLAELAGVHIPSPTTKLRVVDALRNRSRRRAS